MIRYELQRYFDDCPTMPWSRIKAYEKGRKSEAMKDMALVIDSNNGRSYRVYDLEKEKTIAEFWGGEDE